MQVRPEPQLLRSASNLFDWVTEVQVTFPDEATELEWLEITEAIRSWQWRLKSLKMSR